MCISYCVSLCIQVHGLEPSKLKDLTVVNIDIANDPYNDSQAKEEEDPAKFHSEKTGRGPLVGDWKVRLRIKQL